MYVLVGVIAAGGLILLLLEGAWKVRVREEQNAADQKIIDELKRHE